MGPVHVEDAKEEDVEAAHAVSHARVRLVMSRYRDRTSGWSRMEPQRKENDNAIVEVVAVNLMRLRFG
jgi:hypothetical protein